MPRTKIGSGAWVPGVEATIPKTRRQSKELLRIRQELCAKMRIRRAEKRAERRAAEELEASRYWTAGSIVPRGTLRDIVAMVTSRAWLGDEKVSTGQVAILKAIYGLEMTEEEAAEYRVMAEGRPPRPGGYAETTIVAGAGGGKTDKLLANIIVYEVITFDTSVLSPGETAAGILVAQDERGARVALDYIEGKLRLLQEKGHKIFPPSVGIDQAGARRRDVVIGEIRLRDNLVIRVFPCKKVSTRGVSGIVAGLDEIAWWRTEPNAYNSDREIQRAVKSRRRGHTPIMRLVKISSPYGEEGVLFEDWQQRSSNRKLVVQAPTWVLNPSITRDSLIDEELDDPEAFARERGAQFGKWGGNFIPGSLVDLCTDRDRPEVLPADPGNHYVGALDVAFKGDLYVAGVGHLKDDQVIVDGIFWRQGTKRQPLDDKVVNGEAAEFFRQFSVDRIYGDQFADVPTRTEFREHHIEFVSEPQTAVLNWKMWRNMKAVMKRGQVRLPPDPMIRRDLMCLVARPMQGGLTRVAAPERAGFHDDISKVISILVMKLSPAASMDIAEWNKPAEVMPDANRNLDWRERSDDVGIGTGVDIMKMIF